ncbi:MAG: restriction endonuclease [Actinomycetes bacterium]
MREKTGGIDLSLLPWQSRVGSMPSLPGPSELWIDQLAALLTHLQENDRNDLHDTFQFPAGERATKLSSYADQLAPCQLLRRDKTRGVVLTDYAAAWVKTHDAELLATVFHCHVRYFGELLRHLSEQPATVGRLRELANDDFVLGWKSADPVRRRAKWLRLLGFADEIQENKLRITEAGESLLAGLELQEPGVLGKHEQDIGDVCELPQPGPVIAHLLADLTENEDAQAVRKPVFGYVPIGGGGSQVESLMRLTSLAIPMVTTSGFESMCRTEFGVKSSSARSALTMLRNIGLYEPCGRSEFTATAAAREWVEGGSSIDLVRLVHTRIRFVGEFLLNVDEYPRVSELLGVAVSEYGVESAVLNFMQRIARLLKEADLITETGFSRYSSTGVGRALLKELPLAKPVSSIAMEDIAESVVTEVEDLDAVIEELRQASTDSQAPQRFEDAIAACFLAMGLQAERIGGSGDTDVVVDIGFRSVTAGRAIVDAKSSASGVITEKAINLHAIAEHRKKHDAEYMAIVGPSFLHGRLDQWATESGVVLLSVDQLAALVRRQHVTPLSPNELRHAFVAETGWSQLESLWAARDRQRRLVSLIMGSLAREALEFDEVLGTSLDAVSVYRAIRDSVHPRPSTKEIQEILDFLSSDLMGVLTHNANGYSLHESPMTSSDRLVSFASAIAAAAN